MCGEKFDITEYFNSQPHEEADNGLHLKHISRNYFNSQPHEEADWKAHVQRGNSTISTHSLTKRLTVCNVLVPLADAHFNSQPHEEADGNKNAAGKTPKKFQLTASRRG